MCLVDYARWKYKNCLWKFNQEGGWIMKRLKKFVEIKFIIKEVCSFRFCLHSVEDCNLPFFRQLNLFSINSTKSNQHMIFLLLVHTLVSVIFFLYFVRSFFHTCTLKYLYIYCIFFYQLNRCNMCDRLVLMLNLLYLIPVTCFIDIFVIVFFHLVHSSSVQMKSENFLKMRYDWYFRKITVHHHCSLRYDDLFVFHRTVIDMIVKHLKW